jgi:SAM-dependent methyltransferase
MFVSMLTTANYSTEFFQEYELGSLSSAQRILPIALAFLKPHSMVDVGCGVGTWARAAMDLGITDVVGLDGDYIDRTELHIPVDKFLSRDLRYPLHLDRRFDLAVSMEVAEHLPADLATQFVGELTKLAPAVLFSAAIPFQDGNHHVNNRWPSYWAKLFAQFDFAPFDVVRPQVWRDEGVEPWYAQNTILYLSQELAANTTLTPVIPNELFDLVHPEMYTAKMTRPRLRYLLYALPAAVGRRLRHSRGSAAST